VALIALEGKIPDSSAERDYAVLGEDFSVC